MVGLLVLPRPAQSLQNGAGSSGKLEYTGPAEKERGPQCHRVSSWQGLQSRLCQKEQSHLFRSSDREVRESQGEREPQVAEREGDRSARMGRKRWTHCEGRQVPRRRGRASKESLPRGSKRKHERVSGRKSFRGGSAES